MEEKRGKREESGWRDFEQGGKRKAKKRGPAAATTDRERGLIINHVFTCLKLPFSVRYLSNKLPRSCDFFLDVASSGCLMGFGFWYWLSFGIMDL